ncbi:hypothetical protein ACTA71_011678 [Dictyostelium dimigraforme]
MKFLHSLMVLISLLTYVNAYDYFTTTLANQNPACAAVDVPLDKCTQVCNKFVKYVTDTSGGIQNQFTFTEYTTTDCNVQVTPEVKNTFTCADQTTSHQLSTEWSSVCKITVTSPPTSSPPTSSPPTSSPPSSVTPTPTPSQTTGSASTVVASLSLIIFSMILALC